MELLTVDNFKRVSGGVDSISSECFNAVNLYAQWWYYGQIEAETFTSTYTNYCAPDTILIIDSTDLDIIACVAERNVITISLICG